MNSEYILWGIPAYIAYLIFQLAKPVRNRSGWDFVAVLAIFALAIYVTSNTIHLIVKLTFTTHSWNKVASIWKILFPSQGSFKFLIGLTISPVVGVITGTLWIKLHPKLTSLGESWTGRRKSYQFSDVFYATCSDLLGHLVLLTLNNSKVYVGVLLQATDDPNETLRTLKITPIMSGHRVKDSGQVVFDTDYVGNTKDSKTLPNRDLLISMANVVTIAKFDQDLHQGFIASGRTQIRSTFDSPPAISSS